MGLLGVETLVELLLYVLEVSRMDFSRITQVPLVPLNSPDPFLPPLLVSQVGGAVEGGDGRV